MYRTDFEIAALVITLLCFVFSITAKRGQYRLHKGLRAILLNQYVIFLVMLLGTMLSAITSVAGVYIGNAVTQETAGLLYLCYAGYYFFHNLLPACFALYIILVNRLNVHRGKLCAFLYFAPLLLTEVMVLLNRYSKLIFYIDSDLTYQRGPLLIIIYVLGCMYLLLGMYLFFRYKNAIPRSESRAIGSLLVLTIGGVLIQGFFPRLSVELFAESLALAGIMVMIEERGGQIDSATGALNRMALVEDSRRLIESRRSARVVLLKLTNVDLFARLLDGRDMDAMLIQVADWLASVSPRRSLYSYRSRDFAILCPDATDQQAAELAQTILDRFGYDWMVGEASLSLEVAICVVRIPEDVSSIDDFMELLTSGYQKTVAGSQLVTFGELLASRRNRRIEQALRDAVEDHSMRVWYQPIWSVEERRTVAAEALLRIDSDELRGLSPEVYIPVAEQCGIIRDIGLFVFEDVCRFLHEGHADRLGISYIEINLSVNQFMYDDLSARFEEIRTRYGIASDKLNLEITESASINEAPAVEKTMNRLRTKGYTFSLDDFGTGYSNLTQLISSSYKNIKIDKSLLWDADSNETTAQLLDSMIRLIRSMGCNVVQEGVETPEQLRRTENSGGNLIQGYYFSRPLPEKDFVAYLEREKRKS